MVLYSVLIYGNANLRGKSLYCTPGSTFNEKSWYPNYRLTFMDVSTDLSSKHTKLSTLTSILFA